MKRRMTPPPGDAPLEMDKAFDALGKAIRAGVDPQDAARVLGLPALKFTGMTPVALRPLHEE